jgi:hypothetical protein
MTFLALAEPDVRTDSVRKLIEVVRADGEVPLPPLAAMDLCTLGGPRHAVFPQRLADVWLQLNPADRDDFIERATARLVRHGLLIPDPGQPEPKAYALDPRLGIVLAARCRPAFAVVAQAVDTVLPTLSLFALGDQTDPVQAIVSEVLTSIPEPGGKRRAADAARLLASVYAHHLLAVNRAAAVLADWAITPDSAPQHQESEPPRVLTRYQPIDDRQRIGLRIGIWGDGTAAKVTGLDADDRTGRVCDREELETLMTRLLSPDGETDRSGT